MSQSAADSAASGAPGASAAVADGETEVAKKEKKKKDKKEKKEVRPNPGLRLSNRYDGKRLLTVLLILCEPPWMARCGILLSSLFHPRAEKEEAEAWRQRWSGLQRRRRERAQEEEEEKGTLIFLFLSHRFVSPSSAQKSL
jgi:hypothetical protein